MNGIEFYKEAIYKNAGVGEYVGGAVAGGAVGAAKLGTLGALIGGIGSELNSNPEKRDWRKGVIKGAKIGAGIGGSLGAIGGAAKVRVLKEMGKIRQDIDNMMNSDSFRGFNF